MSKFTIYPKGFCRLIAFFLSALCSVHSAQVNNVNFDHFTVREGLPSEQIYNCLRDRDGFLWIGTDAGVSRFDGKTFRNFNINHGLGDNEIHDMYQDRLGRIWFIPFSGKLSYYYGEKIVQQETEALMEGPAHGVTNHVVLAEDGNGNLYLSKAGSKKVIKLRGLNTEPVTYDLSAWIGRGDGFATFYGDTGGRVFCITDSLRLIELKESTAVDVTPAGFLAGEQPLRFYPNRRLYEGYLFFSGPEGIYRLQEHKAKLAIPRRHMPVGDDLELIQLKQDCFGNLWLNHLKYHTFFYKSVNGVYGQPFGILNYLFSITTIDEEGNIWLATNDGLYRTLYARLQDKFTYDINQNLVNRKIISCAVDKDSGLWLGYGNSFATRFKGSTVNHYYLKIERNTNNRIVQIKTDSAGHVLIATDETVAMIERMKADRYGQPVYFRNSKGDISRCSSKCIFFNSRNQAFLSESFAVHDLDLGRKTLRPETDLKVPAPGDTRIFSCFFDKRDRFYISTIDGLQLCENNIVTHLAGTDERFKARVEDYAESSDGTIFLATYNNGLLALKDKKIVGTLPRFNHKTLICRRICLRNDTLYVATNDGIGVLTFLNHKFMLVKLLSVPDGLISPDVNDLAFLGRRLVAATSHGVSIFENLLQASVLASAPVVVLQSIRADDSLYRISPQLQLPSETSLIRIDFMAPVLNRPELTLYRYRFQADDSWQVTSANFMEFSKLKPGRYHIEIQAKKYNSSWSASKTVDFVIRPPFYAAVWFICLGGMLAVVLLFFCIRFFLNRKFRNRLYALQKKEAIEQERNRIAADLHDDIGAELTNITILSRVLKYATERGQEESLKIVSKIEASSNQVITKMNEVIWTLNADNHSLKSLASHIRNYVASLNEHAAAAIELRLCDSLMTGLPLSAELSRNIYLVVKELLQNATKHSGAAHITLEMYLSDLSRLGIAYRDDGTGFDPDTVKRGNGLGNLERRITGSRGAINISSAREQGCSIRIIFPITA
jgi:signal transduction histidine kinase